MKVFMQESESLVGQYTSGAYFQTFHRCFNDWESESLVGLTFGASFQTPHRCFNDLESESVDAWKWTF